MGRWLGLLLLASLLVPWPAMAVGSETTIGADLPIQNGNVRMVGLAAPGSLVTFLHSGSIIGTQVADGASLFDKSFSGQAPGAATYSVYATDLAGRQTDTLSFNVTVPSLATLTINDIVLPPTLRLLRSPLKRPQDESTYGSAANGATVTSFYYGDRFGDSLARQAATDTAGNWQAGAGQTLHLGNYTVNALVATGDGRQSPLTANLTLQVLLSADLNSDGVVNLVDFSILMFHYGVGSNAIRAADINDDTRVNLTDFSVMMFHWGSG